MGSKKESAFYLFLIVLILAIIGWSIAVEWKGRDPHIEEKYAITSRDLSGIKASLILYYCTHGKFPVILEEMVPYTISQLPLDPWGNEYILTSLAWRQKGSGMDILSMGGDGKRGGKGWKRDAISRIDLKEIRCDENI